MALTVLLALAACRSGGGASAIPPGPYYARYGLRLERDRTYSTNYRSDRTSLLLPVNTEVQVQKVGRKAVRLQTAEGRVFTFEHIEKHTKDTLRAAFDKAFAPQPVDLSRYDEEQRAAIERGEAIAGMEREGVLTAMGPPPAVGTLSLDSDDWKYWNTRFTTFLVRFRDGVVTEVGR